MATQSNGVAHPEPPPPGPVTAAAAAAAAATPGYSAAQMAHYLQHIAFPLPLSHPRDATFLKVLHRCQITSIPYENLSLHYNAAHSNSIDPQAIYDKFLPDFAGPHNNTTTTTTRSRGRGGFCFENNIFFLFVLRALGFTAYPSSARIRIRDHHTRVPAGPFVGPCHVVILILLQDGTIWNSDVGFGGDGPIWPLRLSPPSSPGHNDDDEPEIVANLGPQQVRLRKGFLPGTVRPETNPVWFYEYRNASSNDDAAAAAAAWNTYYAFGEAEASLWDLAYCNWWVSTAPTSFQTFQVLGVKFIRGGEEEAVVNGDETDPARLVRITGKVMLADATVKRNMGGKTELVTVCTTEEDRVQVLKEYFGIVLSEEAQQGIRGYKTEIRG